MLGIVTLYYQYDLAGRRTLIQDWTVTQCTTPTTSAA